MAIAQVGTAQATEASSSQSITPTLPSGLATGNIVVIFVSVPGTTPSQHSGTPSGWTQFLTPTYVTDNNLVAGYYRFKDDSWSTGPTISTTASASRTAATAIAYSGVSSSTPLDTSVTTKNEAAASIVLDALTTSVDGAQLVSGALVDSSTTLFSPTAPTGMTFQATTTGGGVGRGMSLADEARPTAGATGTRTWSTGGTVRLFGFMFALRPGSGSYAGAGTAASTSTLTGAITARLLAAGVVSPTATITGNPIRTPLPTSGTTAAAVSSLTGDVIAKMGLLGTDPVAAVISGTLGPFRLGLYGTVTPTATPRGTITSRNRVTSTAPATSTVTGAVGPFRLAVAGRASATSAVSGSITANLIASSTAAATTSISGSLLVTGKPGQGSEVLVLFNPDEVLTGGRVTYYQFDLLDSDENLIGELRGVDGGDVSFDAYASVKSTGKLTVRSDPEYDHLKDNQPDFLGVQINTPLGPQATATATSDIPADHFVCADADASDISVGDQFILTDSASQPKESTAFTVRLKTSESGSTTLWFSTSALDGIAIGDLLKVVEVSYEQRVDWLTSRIRPMVSISRLGGGDDPQGSLVPLGVFLCAAPVEKWDVSGLTREVELTDKLSILDQDIANGDPDGVAAYTLDTGANIIDAVKALIEETGEAAPAIEPSSATLAAPLVWDIGTTRLRVINDLLDAAGYFSLYCDGWGQFQAKPYVQPSDRVPVYESIAPFSEGPESLMDPAWTRDRDIYAIPNRYLLVGQGSGTNAALTSLATNTDETSPYSYQNRGRWITKVEVGVEAADQSALDTLARSRLSKATSITNQLSVSHAFLPDLKINSVVKFVNPGSELDTYCYVVTTSIPFDPTDLCSTTMRLVTP